MKKSQVQDEFIRKRIERQKRIRRRRLIISFYVFIVLLLCTGVVLSLTVFFPIEKLTVTGSAIYTQEEVLSVAEIKKDDNIFAINKNAVLNRLKKKLPYIEEIKLERQLPSTLKIKVYDAEEFASYVKNNAFFIVSKSGWVLSKKTEPPENLTKIYGVDIDCKIGTQLKFKNEDEEILVNSISDFLSQQKIQTDYINISDKLWLEVGVQGRFTVNLGTSNYIEEKIKHLSGMIKNIPQEKQGKINLSMWTTDNTQGTFTAENAE